MSRALQQQRQCPVCHGMLGQVVIYYEHILAVCHEEFAHGCCGIGCDILQRRGIRSCCGNNDGIFHRPVLSQRLRKLSHTSRLLSYGTVDTDYALSLLVKDRIYSHRRFSCLAVTDYQLSLSPSDGEHGIYGEYSRLHGFVHRLPVNDTRCRTLYFLITHSRDHSQTVYGLPKGIYNSSQEVRSRRYSRGHLGPSDQTSFGYVIILSEKNYTYLIMPELLNHALYSGLKKHDLAVACRFQSGCKDYSVSYGYNASLLDRDSLKLPFLKG